MMKKYNALLATGIVAIISIIAVTIAGVYYILKYEPKPPITVTEYVEVPVTEYVTVTEYVPQVQVEYVTETVPQELVQFESVVALREWLGEEGIYSLLLPAGETTVCWKEAYALQDRARRDGYDVFIQTVWPDVYNKHFTLMSIESPHMINATVIGKDVIFIEPQTKEVVTAGYLVGWK
jgi:hypothetical protein